MKRIITILVFIVAYLGYSQDNYNKWSIETEVGFTKVRDITSVQSYNLDLGVRYMANTLFGVKLNANYTDIPKIKYYSGGLHGVVNIGRLLKFESFSKHYTILGGIGGTYTDSGNITNDVVLHRVSNFHLSAFVDNEVKLSNDVFARIGLDVITGVNSRPFVNDISTQTTTILNFNVGLTIALGEHKEHADWYIIEPFVDKIYLKPLVIDKTATNNITESSECNCKTDEYVFFGNDSHAINQDGLNAITKIAKLLKNDEAIHLTGYASPPASIEYNQALSMKRCEAVKDKLISLGVESDKIIISPMGEIDTSDSNNIDLSRRVRLQIKFKTNKK